MRRLMMIIPMLGISLTAPAWAQQTNTVDQQTRQQVEAIVANYVDAINKGDGQAVASLFAPNPINITPNGKTTSGAQIQSGIEAVHKRGLTITAKADQVEPLFGGQGIAATAPYQGTFSNEPGNPQVQGNFMFVLEHSGDSWKVRIFTASRLVPTTAKVASSPTTTPATRRAGPAQRKAAEGLNSRECGCVAGCECARRRSIAFHFSAFLSALTRPSGQHPCSYRQGVVCPVVQSVFVRCCPLLSGAEILGKIDSVRFVRATVQFVAKGRLSGRLSGKIASRAFIIQLLRLHSTGGQSGPSGSCSWA